MDINTREAPGMTAGGEAGSNRLKALEGAFKPDKIAQKGEMLTQKGKNAMTEAASQDTDADDAGAYATDKVSEGAKVAAAKAAAKTKQGAKRSLDEVRKEIRTSRASANGPGAGGGEREYQSGVPSTHSGGYRFSSGDMKGGRTSLYPAGEKPGTDGPGGNAPAGKAGPRAQADPDAIKVRGQSIRTAEHRIRTTAEHTRRAAQRAKKTASEARRAAQRAANEAAKTAAKTSEKAAKTTARTLKEVTEAIFKAVSSLIEKLGAALASGGPVVLVIIAAAVYLSVIMYKIGDIADKFLSIFSLGGAIVWEGDVENLEEMIKDAHVEPNPAILDLNESYHYRLDRIIENNRHDEVLIENPDPDWGDILGFWAAWQLCENGGEFPDFADGQMEGLSEVFNDMVTVEFEVTEEGGKGSGHPDNRNR